MGPRTLGPIGLVCVVVLGLAAFLGSSASPALAADNCPNAVFRAGAGSKLPDCRAYELVTPPYMGGLPPNFEGFLTMDENMFRTDTVTPSGNSVVYHILGGALPGYDATGMIDRYRAKRTPQGWVTESFSPGGEMRADGKPGGVSPDHEYAVDAANEPTALLWPAFADKQAFDVLRTPQGYEPVARGSLGDAPFADTKWISAGGGHIIFDIPPRGEEIKLEPNAAPPPQKTIYDRSPGGPTHVVSLLPNGVAASNAGYLNATKDGTEVAFDLSGGSNQTDSPIFVRRNNSVTDEVVRPNGVVVGKELECEGGPETATLSYQWLRDGTAIGGATESSYTTTAADEGAVVQCLVTATGSEATSLIASATRVVEPYQGKTFPDASAASLNPFANNVAVGTAETCTATTTAGFTVAYQWLRDGVAIGGANEATYTPVEADAGSSLQCRVTVSNAEGTSVGYSPPIAIYRPAPKATAKPAISNLTAPGDSTPAVGDELSCSPGTWSGSPSFAYQWLRSGAEIGGATGSIYTAAAADEGETVQCRVTATNSNGSVAAVSGRVVVDPQPANDPPTQTSPGGVFGAAQVGSSLFCARGEWEPSEYEWEPNYDPTLSFSYQWLRDGAEIGGATSSSYTPTAADRETVVQCRVTATNSGGSTIAIEGAGVVGGAIPQATVQLLRPAGSYPGLTFGGVFNGRVFYSDTGNYSDDAADPGDLYVRDLDEETTTRITDTGDAKFVNVSEDGSHVYYVSRSPIDGQGVSGSPNLGVYSVNTDSYQFIGTVLESDVTGQEVGRNQKPSLTNWPEVVDSELAGINGLYGPANDHSRSTPDGTVLAFESSAQLTAFNNTEENADDCDLILFSHEAIAGERCVEVYRYDTATQEVTCVSCGSGPGPATGYARLQTINWDGGLNEVEPNAAYAPVESLTADGQMVFFESTEGLVSRDGNETKDVYRWKQGEGADLISTGQSLGESALYGVTPDGSNVIFATRQQLLPQDENGSGLRLYDARVGGGFPPPEESVTEPCAGDACQGQAGAAPEAPSVASSSLSGQGNVKTRIKCRKHFRRVVRKGTERCVRRKRHHHHRHHHRGTRNTRRAAR